MHHYVGFMCIYKCLARKHGFITEVGHNGSKTYLKSAFFSFFIMFNMFSGHNVRPDHDIVRIFISAKRIIYYLCNGV